MLCNITDSLLKVEFGELLRRHACKPGTLPNAAWAMRMQISWQETLQDMVFAGFKD